MDIGVVGCGYWGSKHVRVLSAFEEVRSLAAIDPRVQRREELRKSFPALDIYGSLDEALPHLDALVIATPPSSHALLGRRALEAGKHVLIEKPLATTSADATLLIEAAKESGTTLMVGHTFEHNSAVWALRDLVRTGSLGDIRYIDTARLNLGLYQRDINVMWDLAPHDISIINHILDSEPRTVQAWGASHAGGQVEDVAYIRLDYPDAGTLAHVHVSWLDPCKVRRVTVVGSDQMAVYNDLADEERIRVFDKGVDATQAAQGMHEAPVSYRYGGITSPYIAFQEPLAVQDRHFLECIRTGERPTTDGHNGRAVVNVLEAAQLSLATGGPVSLDDLEPGERGSGARRSSMASASTTKSMP